MSNATSTDPIFYAVIDKATGRVGGRQALMDISTAHGSAEIGHILWGSQIAGTRVATEAFFLLADYVFGLGYRRYQWRCNTRNEPSSRAAERFGYTSEGVFRKHMVVKGESRDTAWYSILDQEWVHLRASYERWLRPENFDGDGRQKARLDELR
jgi:RimJ/RimL family protein N-acetyltransferase